MPPVLEHPTVFYSWQSDAPSASNRALIKDALDAAVKTIAQDDSVEVVPRIDHDTAGVAGSPDIGVTILAKIDAAAVFVADVSLVLEDPRSKRRAPNPNVLFELGYAWKSHGAARVILIMNDHFGGPELLPFDLKTKRALRYTNDPDVRERAEARRRLTSALEDALRLALEGLPKPAPKLSNLEEAIDAIHNERRGRDATVREAGKELILEAFETGASLREEIANKWHPDSAERVFELLQAPAPQLVAFATLLREVAIADDAISLNGILASLEAALDATWVSRDFVGPIPRRHLDFVRLLSIWILLATVSSLVREKRYELLRVLLDHRYRPKNPEFPVPIEIGRAFDCFFQGVESASSWRVASKSRAPMGEAIARISNAVAALDHSAPTFEQIMEADAVLALASRTAENGCGVFWWPATAPFAFKARFPWFFDLARKKVASARLPLLGLHDVAAARIAWRDVRALVNENGRPFPPYAQMDPEMIGSLA